MPSSPSSELPPADSQWYFTLDELSRTPSALDGMPLEKERENRAKGVNFITQVGIMLRLPQLTLSIAGVYLQRFFMRYSMVDKEDRKGFHQYVSRHLLDAQFITITVILTWLWIDRPLELPPYSSPPKSRRIAAR